jgi:hypothetical protein
VLVFEGGVRESFFDFVEFEGDVVEGDREWIAVVVLVWWCGFVDALAKFAECGFGEKSFPLVPWRKGVVAAEGAEKLIADGCRWEGVAEDDVVVDFAPVGVGAAEFVEPEFDDWQDEVDVGKSAGLFGCDDAFVAVDEEVVVDAEDADVVWEPFEVGDVACPGVVVVRAVVLDDGFWRVDVQIPAAPDAAARIVVEVRGACRRECSPPCRVTRMGILHPVVLPGEWLCCPKGRMNECPRLRRGEWIARPAGREGGNPPAGGKVGKKGEMKREGKPVKRNVRLSATHGARER